MRPPGVGIVHHGSATERPEGFPQGGMISSR